MNEDAVRILSHPTVVECFSKARQNQYKIIEGSPSDNQKVREDAYYMLRALTELEKQLVNMDLVERTHEKKEVKRLKPI